MFSNGGDSEIDGAEVELLWLPSDNLTVTSSLGWLDARYTDILPGVIKPDGGPLTTEETFVNVPETSFSLAFDYDLPLAAGGRIGLHADWVYNDEMANDLGNTPELMRPSTSLLNASVSFHSPRGWEAIVGGRNLTDERYIITGQNQPAAGLILGTYNRPREYFATVRVNIR